MSEINKNNLIEGDSSDEDDNIDKEQNNTTNLSKKDKKKKKKNKTKPQPKQSVMSKIILERQRLIAEEEARIKALEEEEERKIKEEEELERKKKEEEELEREKKRKIKQDKIQAKKNNGTYKTKSEKEKEKKNKEKIEQMKQVGILKEDGKLVYNQQVYQKNYNNQLYTNSNSNSNSNSDSDSDSDLEIDIKTNDIKTNEIYYNPIEYKSPVLTILGHVDTGKTSLLDILRNSTVQKHETAGITQQIGASFLPKENIIKWISHLNNKQKSIKIPGLLLVDTPGHEAFKNLRLMGSKLADLTIVIVDIVHGLEPQTLESINLLITSNNPFVFAFNKIDRLYGWSKNIDSLPIENIISKQDYNTQSQFESKIQYIKTQIMELGLNCELFWKNDSIEDTINIYPISAITGQGIGDMLYSIIDYSQKVLIDDIILKVDLECLVMEITNTEGFGFTIDCMLKNGILSQGQIIKISNPNSSSIIVTKIKNILTPPPNKDSKCTTEYIHNSSIKGSTGIKIVAQNLDNVLPGSLIHLGNQEDMDEYEKTKIDSIQTIKLDSQGILIHTSTIGSLEALEQFLRKETDLNIKISHANIGTIGKKDLVKLLLTNGENTYLEYLTVLAFEVKIDDDAIQYAKSYGINIFSENNIYRLFNLYKEFTLKMFNERKEKARIDAVFPCVLKIIESNIFNKKNPLIMGIEIQEGTLHIGTPLITLPEKIYIGTVVGIQINKHDVTIGKQGQSVCVKIDNQINQNIMYGRHFTHTNLLYSNISRKSIDTLKEYFKKDITKDDINLLVKLKKLIAF